LRSRAAAVCEERIITIEVAMTVTVLGLTMEVAAAAIRRLRVEASRNMMNVTKGDLRMSI
jgi:hypothetical protein